jgi:hypothetical protein
VLFDCAAVDESKRQRYDSEGDDARASRGVGDAVGRRGHIVDGVGVAARLALVRRYLARLAGQTEVRTVTATMCWLLVGGDASVERRCCRSFCGSARDEAALVAVADSAANAALEIARLRASDATERDVLSLQRDLTKVLLSSPPPPVSR